MVHTVTEHVNESCILKCNNVHTGIHKLVNFSEGVRESLRRLSHVTWMADELHKATYYLFSKSVSLIISSPAFKFFKMSGCSGHTWTHNSDHFTIDRTSAYLVFIHKP